MDHICPNCHASFDHRRDMKVHKRTCRHNNPIHRVQRDVPETERSPMDNADDLVTTNVDVEHAMDETGDLSIAHRRRQRTIQLPKRYRDMLPAEPTPVPQVSRPVSSSTTAQSRKRPRLDPPPISPPHPEPIVEQPVPTDVIETEPNEVGLYRQYRVLPSRDPDGEITIDTVSDAPSFLRDTARQEVDPLAGFGSLPSATTGAVSSTSPKDYFFPFRNASIFRLMIWFYSSTTKTLADLDRLVYSVITAPDFKASDFEDFSATVESKRLDHDPNSEKPATQVPFTDNDIWHTSTVSIPLPLTGRKHPSEDEAPKLDVKFHHRDLIEVVKSAAHDHNSESLHWKGYKMFWKPSEGERAQRVYGEAYTSDFFLELEEEITPVEGCNLETVVIALFLYSDATLLANFGDLSLWPIYVWLGNLSKYIRGKTRSFTAHHLAYLPSLPDMVQDVYKSVYETVPAPSILTFLKRELIQAIWRHLLNEEFKNAYKYGIIVKCKDGQFRRFYPRFFLYSADYPEKTLLASIKQKGKWLCTLCKIKVEQILQLGTRLHDKVWSRKFRLDSASCATKIDEARKWIFERGMAVDSERINLHLGESLVAVKNAFSGFLSPMNRNYFELFARDLMHEFELGVWKAVFIHLIRILYTYGNDSIAELNHRFRTVPRFGQYTIRRSRNNVSAMKNLAARDYEDILQCAGPCFEGLFLKTSKVVDRKIQQFLFILAWWHAYAKLRLHTDSSLHVFRGVTDMLTKTIRDFSKSICPLFTTSKTPGEAAAATRRQAKTATTGSKSRGTNKTKEKLPATNKMFNIATPKMHFMVHYANSIAQFGTNDSMSTQIGEQEHRRVKQWYERTNRKEIERQIALLERRQTKLREMEKAAREHDDDLKKYLTSEDTLPPVDPSDHHQMSKKKHRPHNIYRWKDEHANDPAFENFVPDLRNHLTSRLLSLSDPRESRKFTSGNLNILNDTIYSHGSLRINYTSYDNRRDQDFINPRTHSDVMVLADDDTHHPYLYARVFGIFHTVAKLTGQRFQQVEFLWVRWLQVDEKQQAGFAAKRMYQVRYRRRNNAFGFMNPDDVLRACHLIPSFVSGFTEDILDGSSIARRVDENDQDYDAYYVNMFADRDMFMRFTGGGIGHRSTWDAGSNFRGMLEEIFGRWYQATGTGTEADVDEQSGSDSDVEEENIESESENEENDDDEEGENEEIDPDFDDGEPEIDEEVLGFSSL